MPIKVTCKCGQQFAAKDELAGKVVKCPKCKQPLKIGGSKAASSAPPPAEAGSASLGDLLDEVGFHVHDGEEENIQHCPACDAEISDHALLCVACGFHLESGKFAKGTGLAGGVQTAAKAEGHAGAAQRLLSKADESIEYSKREERKMRLQGTPLWLLTIFVTIIVSLAVTMSVLPRKYALLNTGFIWVGICGFVYSIYWIHLVVVAFTESVGQGLMFMFVPFYWVYYVITRWAECRRLFLICVYIVIISLGGLGLILWSGSMVYEPEEKEEVRVQQSYFNA